MNPLGAFFLGMFVMLVIIGAFSLARIQTIQEEREKEREGQKAKEQELMLTYFELGFRYYREQIRKSRVEYDLVARTAMLNGFLKTLAEKGEEHV